MCIILILLVVLACQLFVFKLIRLEVLNTCAILWSVKIKVCATLVWHAFYKMD